MDFDVIPFDDIKGNWKKLGSGSFGNVYKGTYLGIDVAIKEVLPSTDYDVAKYFEREWRLMKEARHPNVVLYLGLSRAPPPDGRIFIVSEFIEAGNLRTYLHNKTNPLPWRLRLSFSIDVARALAYLHARNCIHRDMKGENLLLTSNGRLKITDFGFARIAAQSLEERKRLTFCGTDSYMSPEILMGNEFGLSTDVYSLGIIFCEIICRKLADDHTFKRSPPYYELDTTELRDLASPGAPEDFIKLAIQCCSIKPSDRPNMLQVLDRLRAIELEVLNRPNENENYHVGSVKLFTGVGTNRPKNARPGVGPRIPSFGMGVGQDIRHSVGAAKPSNGDGGDSTPEETSEDEEIMEAISNIKSSVLRNVDKKEDSEASSTAWSQVTVKQDGTRAFGNANDSLPLQHQHMEATAHKRDQQVTDGSLSDEPLLKQHEPGSLIYTDYSTSVVRSGKEGPPNLSSILTVRPSPNLASQPQPAEAAKPSGQDEQEQEPIRQSGLATLTTDSRLSTNSFHTAHTPSVMLDLDNISIAAATEGGSTVRSEIIGGLHRFTLIKPGGVSNKLSKGSPGHTQSATPSTSWSPFQFFFSSFVSSKSGGNASKVPSGGVAGKGNTASAKCDLCNKRLGWKPVLECDDCGLRAHIKCGELAPRDCGLMQPLSPTGKGKGNTKNR